MAGYKVTPPDLEDCKSFDTYKKRLLVWEATTPAPEEKRGAIIASTLPNTSRRWPKDLQDKFFEQVDGEALVLKNGLKLVKEFLEKELAEDDLCKMVRVWEEFEDCSRGNDSIDTYISSFERCYTAVVATSPSSQIPAEIRAFMVLKRSGASEEQRMLVLAKLNKDDKPKMFNDMCNHLKLILGGGPGSRNSKMAGQVKVEPSSEEEGVFFTSSGERLVKENNFYRGRGRGGGWRGRGGKPYDRPKFMENRKDENGKVTQCNFCSSTYHYQGGCEAFKASKVGEKKKEQEAHLTQHEEEIDFALAAQHKSDLSLFTREARNCAALDTCCTSSVAGEQWLDIFVESLDEASKAKLKGPLPSNRVFKFGNNGHLRSVGSYILPAVLAGKNVTIQTDVVESDIPLLLSKIAMKKLKMKIDLDKDKCEIFGQEVELMTTSSGHYCLNLLNKSKDDEDFAWVLAVDLASLSNEEQFKSIVKLHKQMGHHPKKKFVDLLKDANAWYEGADDHLDKIIDDCEGCLLLKRNPDRPVVSMPMASRFNEKLAMDLKNLSTGEHILHLVDMWSRYTLSFLIERKEPKEVINAFMENWARYFGLPAAILNDNGGEFTSAEMREVKSVLNIIDLTTAAQSPWQNGICEKNHQLVDTMWLRMQEDFPEIPAKTLLAWANMAKNSLKTVHGFSPNQLIFGINPVLPNVLSAGPPALEGKPFSETLAIHLDALHSARKAFIESENSERIRKALRKKICTNNTIYRNGDQVWYKRKDGARALGPGKVVFQDGKIVFVRHGMTYVRVSVNRIVKKGSEFSTTVPGPSSQGGLGEEGALVGTTTPSGPSPPRGSGVPVRKAGSRSGSVAKTVAASAERKSNPKPIIEVDDYLDEEDSFGEEEPNDSEAVVIDPQTLSDDLQEASMEEESIDTESVVIDSQSEPLTGDSQGEGAVGTDPGIGEEIPDTNVMVDNGKRKRVSNNHKEGAKRRAAIDTDNSELPRPQKVIFPKNKGRKINLKKDDVIEFEENGEDVIATVINREKVSGNFYNYFNVRGEDGLMRNVDLERLSFRKLDENECNMVMIPRERHSDLDCKEAMVKELEKLKHFDSYDTVDDDGQYRISCRAIYWLKGDEVRARLVARGFEEKDEVPSDSPTVDKSTMRLLLIICQSEGWVLESSDVKSAFLQGCRLDREVLMKPPREANVPKGKLWKLKVCLYGLNDASLQFYLKCKSVLISTGCTQSQIDPALFFKFDKQGKLIGVIISHVDDFLHAGNDEFKRSVVEKLAQVFQMGKTESRQFKYVGFELDQTKNGIIVSQNEYAKEVLPFDVKPERAKQVDDELNDEERSLLRKVAGKVGWLGRGSRPDLTFAQIEMSTKFVKGKVKDLNQAAKAVRKVKDSENFFLVKNLGPVEGWTVEVDTDASLGNLNEGVDSTGAFVVIVRNGKQDCAPVSWQCNKIKRIVDNTLAAECISLVEGLKEAIHIREIIEEVYGLKERSVPVEAIIDNRGTVDAVHSTTAVADKRLRRDISLIKQMLNTKEITGVNWCSGKDQIADCMTKRGAAAWSLLQLFQSGNRKLD
jgi:transposase InsO family protein